MIGDDVILLDVDTGRYSALSRDLVPGFLRTLGGSALSAADESALGPLIGTLIQKVGTNSATIPPRQRHIRATHLVAETRRHWAPWELVQTCTARILAQRQLRRCPFSQVISKLEGLKAKARPDGTMRKAEQIAHNFRTSFHLIARADNCLPTAIGLASILWRNGFPASVVIGVRTGPFAAHSWVQIEDALVCDDLDRTASFTPIITI